MSRAERWGPVAFLALIAAVFVAATLAATVGDDPTAKPVAIAAGIILILGCVTQMIVASGRRP